MHKTEREHREDIVQIGRLVFQKEWAASNHSNISIRLDTERILATPTGMCNGMMHPDDLIVLDDGGKKISGHREETSEINMHLAIYNLRPDIRAVVHARPPVATGFAAAGKPLNPALLPEAIIACVPIAEYDQPGTMELLIEPMRPLIPKHNALLLVNHGAVCYGEDVFQAYFRMETVEHSARIQLFAQLVGGPKVLPRREVDELLHSRERYVVKAAASGDLRGPIAAKELGAEDRITLTRAELISLVDGVIRARGLG